MTDPRSALDPPAPPRWLRLGGAAAGVAVLSAAVGVVLAALAARTHPVVMVLVPAAAVAVAAAVHMPWVGVAGVVAAVPLAATGMELGPLEPIEVLVLGATGALVVHRVEAGRTPLPWPSVAWWPVAIGLLTVLSVTRAVDVEAAVGQLVLLGVGGLAFLTTVGGLRGPDEIRRVAIVWCATGVGVSLHALAGAGELAASSGGLTVAGRPTGAFTSPNQLGAYAGMTLLVALGLWLAARHRWQQLLAAGTGLAATAALGVSLSRGAWVATGVAVLVVVMSLPAARRLAGRLLVPAVVVGAVVGALVLPPAQLQVVGQRFDTLVEGERSPYDNRDAIWAEGVRQALDDPWLGQGPANFPAVSRRATSQSSFVSAEHAHNLPLNIAAEFGVPVLLLVAGFALTLLRSARRASHRLPQVGSRALVAAAAGVLVVQIVHGAVDYTLRNPTLAVLTWVAAGIVAAQARGVSPVRRTAGP